LHDKTAFFLLNLELLGKESGKILPDRPQNPGVVIRWLARLHDKGSGNQLSIASKKKFYTWKISWLAGVASAPAGLIAFRTGVDVSSTSNLVLERLYFSFA
jgi:hypothetical protein